MRSYVTERDALTARLFPGHGVTGSTKRLLECESAQGVYSLWLVSSVTEPNPALIMEQPVVDGHRDAVHRGSDNHGR